MGVPFVAVRGLLGSDILRHRGDLRVVENPFQPAESVDVAEPIRPEVAVFHARRADRFGNSLVPGGMRDDLMMARAGRWVVVTAEEIQEKEIRPEDAGSIPSCRPWMWIKSPRRLSERIPGAAASITATMRRISRNTWRRGRRRHPSRRIWTNMCIALGTTKNTWPLSV